MFYLDYIYEKFGEHDEFDTKKFVEIVSEAEKNLRKLHTSLQAFSFYPVIKNSIECKYARFYDLFSDMLNMSVPESQADFCTAFISDIEKKKEALQKINIDRSYDGFEFDEFLRNQKEKFAPTI